MVVGGSCEDDGSAVEVWILKIDASISPVVVSSGGTVCSARGGPCDGSVGSNGIGVSFWRGDRIPKCCCIYLRMALCWVWVAISWSWCACMAAICWVRMLWVAVNVCKVWHRPLNSEIGMATLDSDGWGSDGAGTTGGVPGVAWGAEGATSVIGPVEGTAGAGALMSVSNSTGYGFSRCFGCGLYESSGPIGNRYGNTRLRWMRLRCSWYYWWSLGSGMRCRGCNLSHRSCREHCRDRCSHVRK